MTVHVWWLPYLPAFCEKREVTTCLSNAVTTFCKQKNPVLCSNSNPCFIKREINVQTIWPRRHSVAEKLATITARNIFTLSFLLYRGASREDAVGIFFGGYLSAYLSPGFYNSLQSSQDSQTLVNKKFEFKQRLSETHATTVAPNWWIMGNS